MVTPASPESNSERYTAGDCVLDVQTQPSALSQWSAKPIADQLRFQLWLASPGAEIAEPTVDRQTVDRPTVDRSSTDEGRSLLAQGDHTDLQSLSQYFQHQAQQVLAIASLNRSRQTAQPAAPPRPQSLQIATPLSYLQLADITAVLSQYEQSVRLLPVSLKTATNVVSLDEARRQVARKPIRKKRNPLWMSSAAAALFAVGLTSTLWLRDSSLQELNTASESVSPAPQSESSQVESSVESSQATLPEISSDSEAADMEADTTDAPQKVEAEARAPSAAAPSTGTSSAGSPDRPSNASPPQESATAQPAPVRRRPDTDFSSPDEDGRVPTTPPVPPTPEAASPPAAEPDTAAPNTEPPADESDRAPEAIVQSAERESAERESAPQEPVQRGTAQQEPVAESEPENVFTPPPSAGAPTSQTGGASRRRAPQRASQPVPQSAPERATQDESLTLPSTEEAAPEIEDTETLAGLPEAEQAQIIEQVRRYFQQRWQPSETDSLSYQLALSTTGEVVRFEGTDDVSRDERDRILPTTAPPSFQIGTVPAPINLRVLFRPNGTVQVQPL